jgi:hypothetical protein
LHTQFAEHIDGDLGFIVLANGDFRVSRNHGDACRAGCCFQRDANNDLAPARDGPFDLSLFEEAPIQLPPPPSPPIGPGDPPDPANTDDIVPRRI